LVEVSGRVYVQAAITGYCLYSRVSLGSYFIIPICFCWMPRDFNFSRLSFCIISQLLINPTSAVLLPNLVLYERIQFPLLSKSSTPSTEWHLLIGFWVPRANPQISNRHKGLLLWTLLTNLMLLVEISSTRRISECG